MRDWTKVPSKCSGSSMSRFVESVETLRLAVVFTGMDFMKSFRRLCGIWWLGRFISPLKFLFVSLLGLFLFCFLFVIAFFFHVLQLWIRKWSFECAVVAIFSLQTFALAANTADFPPVIRPLRSFGRWWPRSRQGWTSAFHQGCHDSDELSVRLAISANFFALSLDESVFRSIFESLRETLIKTRCQVCISLFD